MKYKNISDYKIHLVGFGEFEPGEIVETEKEINSVNFVLVTEAPKAPVQEPTETVDKKETK